MRTIRLVCTATLIACCLATAQLPDAQTAASIRTEASDDASKALESRFREYSDALTKKDTKALDQIWADEYTFVNPRGELVTKAQRLANIQSGATEFQAISPKQDRIKVVGDVAVDVGTVKLQGTKYGGQESSGNYRYMNVWVKKSGSWQMLANQITRIVE